MGCVSMPEDVCSDRWNHSISVSGALQNKT
jgi:hypothetical protein